MHDTPTPETNDHEARVPNADAGGAPAREERVSTLVGDRLCSNCGYNLMGQPVLRESHYDMLIVRCPECATIAAPQEYPLAGRWTNRFVALAASVALLFTLGLFIVTVGSLLLGSLILVEASIEGLRSEVRQIVSQNVPNYYGYGGSQAFQAWWTTQPEGSVFKAVGGWRAVAWDRTFFAFIPTLIAFALGTIWSVVLIHWPRRRLPFFALVVAVIFAVILTLSYWSQRSDPSAGVSEVVWLHYGLPLYAGLLMLGLSSLLVGLMTGRATTRGLIRAFVAPRLRGPLSFVFRERR